MNPETLRGMVVFVEVARLKGFSRAAAALDMPVSTVSRRVAALEREIGLRLLKRSTKKVELTEEGEAYFLRCQRIIEEAESAHEELLGTRLKPRG
ncbi:MAG: LysR family transcriptional regulator, partial [Pseudomonadota bacterium]